MPNASLTRAMVAALFAGALLLSACGSTPADSAAPVATSSSPDGTTTTDNAAPDAANPVLTAIATAPDGSTFTIADHAGKTVFVETFATWCGNCRRQLGDTNAAAGQVADDVVFLVLSIENNLEPSKLDDYAAEHGFDNVIFGVLAPESLAAFNDHYGNTVLNAPSTPKFIVSPDGTLGEMTTGFESVEEILAQVA